MSSLAFNIVVLRLSDIAPQLPGEFVYIRLAECPALLKTLSIKGRIVVNTMVPG